jgi:hypothetical protein
VFVVTISATAALYLLLVCVQLVCVLLVCVLLVCVLQGEMAHKSLLHSMEWLGVIISPMFVAIHMHTPTERVPTAEVRQLPFIVDGDNPKS